MEDSSRQIRRPHRDADAAQRHVGQRRTQERSEWADTTTALERIYILREYTQEERVHRVLQGAVPDVAYTDPGHGRDTIQQRAWLVSKVRSDIAILIEIRFIKFNLASRAYQTKSSPLEGLARPRALPP